MTDPHVHQFITMAHPYPVIVSHVNFNNAEYLELSEILSGDDQYAAMALVQADDMVVYCDGIVSRTNLHEILDELGFPHHDVDA